ncbi:hypothetical protein [Ectopseudomonas toyotomiensis]|uniref:hypothetical protein n=1 Tax=Ectopseudomonas toyotomiensis TaxID=554344 RepID=UPI003D132BAB
MKRFEMPESMKLASIWVVWGFLAIGALGWALFVVLDFFGVKEQAAAWVQAVGSITAIGAAIWISERGHRRDREIANQAKLDELCRVVGLAERGVYECFLALQTLSGGSPIHTYLARIEQSAEILRMVFMEQLPYETASDVCSALAHVAEIKREVCIWVDTEFPDDWKSTHGNHVEAVRRSLDSIRRAHVEHVNRAGLPAPTHRI